MLSSRSSICSESAASEIDPHFRSLKQNVISSQLNPPYSPSSSSTDSPISFSPTVTFPLPPRRLRPGEIIGLKDSDPPPNLNSTQHQSVLPTHPASLYGVAIGGSRPIKTNPTLKGRAQVQTDGLTSLDLRKMTLRARLAKSPSNHLSSQSETFNLRARNPSRMLAPHQFPLQNHFRHQVNLNPSTLINQHFSNLDPISMETKPSPQLQNLSHPPRNYSLLPSYSNFIPPNRLPYQSLSYHLDNSIELSHQTLSSIKQPLDEVLSDPLPNSDSQPRLTELAISSVPQNRIKFAPLPHKPTTSTYLSSSKSNLSHSQNVKSKQGSKKKTAWIGRWFLTQNPTQDSRSVSNQNRPEISLPVPQTFVVTNTATSMTSAMVPTIPIKRRSSVGDQQTHPDVSLQPQRPRSRSFSSVRPTLGMMANIVQRSPSRSLEETLISGKTLLHGSQQIRSPTRIHSLKNLIAQDTHSNTTAALNVKLNNQSSTTNTVDEKSFVHPQGKKPSIVIKSGNYNKIKPDIPPDLPPDTLLITSKIPLDQCNPIETSETTKENPHSISKPTREESDLPKLKKKREIRFRNTLELIPDPVFKDPTEIVTPIPLNTSNEKPKSTLPSTESSTPPQNNKTKPPARNLNLFSHLRKPRSIDLDYNDPSLSNSPLHHSAQRIRQPNDRTNVSIPNGSTKYTHSLLSRNQRDTANDENVNLCTRKLAPKINLTFVDLDHHIGSRFSVNTLFKEVQKSLPEILLNEETQSVNSGTSNSDPITQTERQLTSRQDSKPKSEDRHEEKDGSLSDTLESSTTSTIMSNPVEMDPCLVHSGHNSVIEVVKTNGADVVFQMVVPVTPSSMKMNTSCERRASSLTHKDTIYHLQKGDDSENVQDDLTVISERLVALNNSIQAQEARSSKSEINHGDNNTSSHANNNNPLNSKHKVNRVDNWLSTVPSPLPFANNKTQPPHMNLQSSHLFPKVGKDELETLDQMSEYPESPIDRYHIPSRPTLKTS